MRPRAAVALAFVSGFVALGYEILWARRLSDLIGATALASSLVVGVFFVLLAAGAIVLGPVATRSRSPWRLYAQLELGILAAILPAFIGDVLAGGLSQVLGETLLQPGTNLVVKSALAVLFVGPASFLMGGTLPAMGQAVVRAGRLGREGNLLYGANTLGGAIGIVVVTFALLPALGMHRSFIVLMSGSIALMLAAWRFAARPVPVTAADIDVPAPSHQADTIAVSPRAWELLACVSGFNVLGLEILALHLFSQVLHNSTYTFATVLIVVIAALAAGALVTQRWQLDAATALRRCGLALLGSALATALVPRVFFAATGGMQPLGGGVTTLGGYVLHALAVAALVIGPAFVLAGWVFPLVLAGSRGDDGVGKRWGRLLGTNAAGALLGLVIANFVCMRFLGLWVSIAVWCVPALVAGGLVTVRLQAQPRRLHLALGAAALVALVAAFPGALPRVALAPGDTVLGWSSGPDGIATVVANSGVQVDRRIKWNNTYTLGGMSNAAQQARMGQLALLLHPNPRQVGYIGLATGITASSALRDPAVQRADAVELSPQITALACRWFADGNGDLCTAPRVRIVVEDGRTFFQATRAQYDVVVGDLFVPWQAGSANLYTREHFEAVHDRLAPGGLFAQWLPLFQLDALGFQGIAATFESVFPGAWLALADFQPYNPAVALIGWRDAGSAPSRAVIAARCRQTSPLVTMREPMLADATGVASFLVGPVQAMLPEGIPLMTLDRPWLGDHAPRVQRARPPRWFEGELLVESLSHAAAAVTDDSLRADIARGQALYRFCELLQREGPERATAWFEAHVPLPLPPGNFDVERPAAMNWPFPRDAGLFLLARARGSRP